jgi:hypothetical protein
MLAVALLAAALGTGSNDCTAPVERERRVERRAGARVLRTAVIACDSGRRVVVRRARLVDPASGRPRGRTLTDVATAGGRVAWGEVRFGPRRMIGRLGVRGAPGQERVVLRRRARSRVPTLEVVISSRGELAWLTGGRVLAARRRESARLVSRDAYLRLALEDDRTLRWRGQFGVRFADLRPSAAADCPRRSLFRVVAESADVLVTEAVYEWNGEVDHVIRACVRATGADPVIAQFIRMPDGDEGEVLEVSGRWVTLRRATIVRGRRLAAWVVSVDAVTGERAAHVVTACVH